MTDEWITLSEIFDNLRGYEKHHYGCGVHYGITCDCGLLRYQSQMEEIIQRFVKAGVIARMFKH